MMETVRPADGMEVRESVRLEPGTYILPRGISVAADGVHVSAEGVAIAGVMRKGRGLSITGCKGVQIEGLSLRDYYHGLYASNCEDLVLSGCCVTSTSEVEPNTIFLDIWLPSEKAYGGGICLVRCNNSVIKENDLQHQMNGLLTYHCERLEVINNLCNYNSGYGIHLFDTSDSLFEGNSCDYCCRFEPREGGLHHGHMGADSAGFLAVMGSSGNRFLRNTARLGGDGFFLAGLAPDGTPCGCDNNIFEENDASLSPNIAFEATFSSGNIFRRNFADRCNYGFWLGYSRDAVIENNRILFNRQAGIAVENGVGFHVKGNQFQSNGHGILLWSKFSENATKAYPDRDTSRDWRIEKNRFLKNNVGILIAGNRDHGIRKPDPKETPKETPRPHSHQIIENDIQDNRIGIALVECDVNIIARNTLNANVEANLRLEDSNDNEIVNNLGLRGAYL